MKASSANRDKKLASKSCHRLHVGYSDDSLAKKGSPLRLARIMYRRTPAINITAIAYKGNVDFIERMKINLRSVTEFQRIQASVYSWQWRTRSEERRVGKE